VGTYLAVRISQVLGVAVLATLTAALRPSLAMLGGLTAAGLVGAGLLTLLGWLSYYGALERGPVGLVGAIAATYGGITALLAVAVLRERLGRAGDVGVALAGVGVGPAASRTAGPAPAGLPAGPGRMATVTGRRRRARTVRHFAGPGIQLAMASALTYGVGAFLLGGYSADTGWLLAALVAYASSVAALIVVLPFVK